MYDNKTNAENMNCTTETSDHIIGAEEETGRAAESCSIENGCSKAEIVDAKSQGIDNIRWYMHHPKNFEDRLSEKKFKTDVSLSAFPCFAHEGYTGIGVKKIGEATADALHNVLNVKRIDFRSELRISADQAERYGFSFLKAKDTGIFAECTRKYLMTLFPDANNDKELFIYSVIAFDNIVNELKRNPAKAKAVLAPEDAVFLKGDPDHRTRCNPDINAILSTSGSKYKVFQRCIDLSVFNKSKRLWDLCARTAIGDILYANCFKKIYCFDTDIKMAVFFSILRKHPEKLERAIKHIISCSLFRRQSIEECYVIIDRITEIDDENKRRKNLNIDLLENKQQDVLFSYVNTLINQMKGKLDNIKSFSTMSLDDKIKNAAYLYLLIHFTKNGFMEGFDKKQTMSFLKNINKRMIDLADQAKILQKKGDKFKYINDSWINYTHKFIDKKRDLAILDLPYIHPFGFPCYDYDKEHPFTWNHVKAFMKPFKGAKCKCIMFCSDNLEFEKAAIEAGFKKARYYDDSGYRTIIYTLNISDAEAERAFINLGRFE